MQCNHRKLVCRAHTLSPILPLGHSGVTHRESGYFRPTETPTQSHTHTEQSCSFANGDALSSWHWMCTVCRCVSVMLVYVCVHAAVLWSQRNGALYHTLTPNHICISHPFFQHVWLFPTHLCESDRHVQEGYLQTVKKELATAVKRTRRWMLYGTWTAAA